MRVRVLTAAVVSAGLVMTGMTASASSVGTARPSPKPGAATEPMVQAMRDFVAPHRLPAAPKMPSMPRVPLTPMPLVPEEVGVEEAAEVALGHAGERVHRFHYPGADYVKVHFDDVSLLPGDRVTVADPRGTEVHSYRADGKLLRPPEGLPVGYDEAGGLWAMSVTGDTAVVTLRPAEEALTRGAVGQKLVGRGVTIDKVARGLTEEERKSPAGPGSEESICGGDDSAEAVCYQSDHQAEYARSRPVARLLINGTMFCTAWRIGPRNRMLTNHHCFSRAQRDRDTEVWFNYQCTSCGSDRVGRVTKVWGDDVVATERRLDYTLFTVDDFAAIRDFGYLELDTSPVARGEELYVPQHPDGEPKRIALADDGDPQGACRVDDPRYDGYVPDSDLSYYCDTSSGSSGSPVLSRRTHKVVALHHFGGCPNSGVRADLLHEALAGKV